jgi:juvenile hormone epoxide hydrolase
MQIAGTGLSVSPSALAAFFLEKLSAWSTLGKEDGGWSMDDLLDNLMIYWTTNTLKTSMSLYTEQFTKSQRSYNMDR